VGTIPAWTAIDGVATVRPVAIIEIDGVCDGHRTSNASVHGKAVTER
jgi:hypothetical protein